MKKELIEKHYLYLLYDGRYYSQPDRASVLTVSETLKEARDDQRDFPDSVIVKCKDENGLLTNHEIVG